MGILFVGHVGGGGGAGECVSLAVYIDECGFKCRLVAGTGRNDWMSFFGVCVQDILNRCQYLYHEIFGSLIKSRDKFVSYKAGLICSTVVVSPRMKDDSCQGSLRQHPYGTIDRILTSETVC